MEAGRPTIAQERCDEGLKEGVAAGEDGIHGKPRAPTRR